MESLIRRYDHPDVHLAVDGKHQTLEHGWVVVSISFLTKDVPRNTDLPKYLPGASRSVQGMAATTRARIVMQAIVENDNLAQRAVALMEAFCKFWADLRGEELPPKVKHVHKDFADAYEHARQLAFPESRPVDCFFSTSSRSQSP